MFGRAINPFHAYSTMKETIPMDAKTLKSKWMELRRHVIPAVNERIQERQEQLYAKIDASRHIVEDFKPGQYVLAKDPTRGSKWNDIWEGPYLLLRKNTGGSYVLEDPTGHPLSYRFPPDHLITAPFYEPSEEESHEIKKITAHRGEGEQADYLVQWRNPSLPETWVNIKDFDSRSIISKYHKTLTKIKKDLDKSQKPRHSSNEEHRDDVIQSRDETDDSGQESGILHGAIPPQNERLRAEERTKGRNLEDSNYPSGSKASTLLHSEQPEDNTSEASEDSSLEAREPKRLKIRPSSTSTATTTDSNEEREEPKSPQLPVNPQRKRVTFDLPSKSGLKIRLKRPKTTTPTTPYHSGTPTLNLLQLYSARDTFSHRVFNGLTSNSKDPETTHQGNSHTPEQTLVKEDVMKSTRLNGEKAINQRSHINHPSNSQRHQLNG
jgi:hypothetical protein